MNGNVVPFAKSRCRSFLHNGEKEDEGFQAYMKNCSGTGLPLILKSRLTKPEYHQNRVSFFEIDPNSFNNLFSKDNNLERRAKFFWGRIFNGRSVLGKLFLVNLYLIVS